MIGDTERRDEERQTETNRDEKRGVDERKEQEAHTYVHARVPRSIANVRRQLLSSLT